MSAPELERDCLGKSVRVQGGGGGQRGCFGSAKILRRRSAKWFLETSALVMTVLETQPECN